MLEEMFFWLGMLMMVVFALITLYYGFDRSNVAQILCTNCYTLNPCTNELCQECGSEIQDY